MPISLREAAPRSAAKLIMLGVLVLAAVAGLLALGSWQVARRSWKLDLIARVDARLQAAPVEAPGPTAWPQVSRAADEYRRIRMAGRLLNGQESLVQAATELGGGFWVMTPLRTAQGFVVLVNRGFVPPDRRDPASRAAGQPDAEVTITGLLRITEPKGGFLRSNDPAAGRWHSRDVAAIAASHGLSDVAPYFIDADATPNPGGWPMGGLTVVAFPNNHLVYALTWYGLALMLGCAAATLGREEWRRRAGTAAACGGGV